MTLLDTLLSQVDHLTGRLGPLTTLLDTLVSRIAPTTTAKACGGNVFCHRACGGYGACCTQYPATCAASYNVYADNGPDCYTGLHWTECFIGCGC
jgi:hypothetical protein